MLAMLQEFAMDQLTMLCIMSIHVTNYIKIIKRLYNYIAGHMHSVPSYHKLVHSSYVPYW